ncbi:MAG: D-erythro-7,8-dihydroneopterin triphosphate epimerase [Oleiphilaceae bacterium]|jgi:D-erythro-7,8-dihydroneopterin triphosphate epimerase
MQNHSAIGSKSLRTIKNVDAPFVMSNATINIENLRLRTFIGFNPDELVKQQDIIINALIEFDATKPSISDDEKDTLDYKVITKAIIKHVENGKFRLVEKLNADIVAIIMDNPQVLKTHVRVEKPHALRFADSVSVSLAAERTPS